MSGGVDSSVSAYLLHRQGYQVVGVFLRCFNIDGCAQRDAVDARRVAEQIGIPFYVWDFEDAYKSAVVDYMIAGYRSGITPNPDVMCNREIKFGLFLKKAIALGADFVATGHYARISGAFGHRIISAGVDTRKDQSYFLWTLTPDQLNHVLFPIGRYEKPTVREIAKKAALVTAEKKDSQGVCFLGSFNMTDFLKQYIPCTPGPIVSVSGEVIGTHDGLSFYTIGQRHLGVDLKKTSDEHAHTIWYVSGKDIATNSLIVAPGNTHPALFTSSVFLSDLSCTTSACMNRISTGKPMAIRARVRYRQPLFSATLSRLSPDRIVVSFATPQRFVAPGQSLVFYSPSTFSLWGGGVIAERF
jgi:tRNA-specific 2-thiouridylase